MIKKSLVVASSLMLGFSAYAQNNQTSSMQTPSNTTGRSAYIANGIFVGAAYDHLDMEAKIKIRNKKTGDTFESTGKSDSAADLAGIKVGFASIPKTGLGFNGGLTAMKINQSSSDGKTYYDIRGEGNLTLATQINQQIAIYGFGGGNLNHITGMGGSSTVQDIGLGLQLGGGIGIGSNFSLEAGYVASMHQLKDSVLDANSGDWELDKTNSYVMLKGLMARATYNF